MLTFNGYLIENRFKVNKVVFKVARYFPDHTKVFYYDGDSFSERIRGATSLLVALGELRNTQIWCSRGGRLKLTFLKIGSFYFSLLLQLSQTTRLLWESGRDFANLASKLAGNCSDGHHDFGCQFIKVNKCLLMTWMPRSDRKSVKSI